MFRARDAMTGDAVALKRIFIRAPEDGLPENVQREVKCMQLVRHPNVVRIRDVFSTVRSHVVTVVRTVPCKDLAGNEEKGGCMQAQHLVTVLELCERDLYSVLHAAVDRVPPAIIKRCLRDTLRGAAAIHRAGERHPPLLPCGPSVLFHSHPLRLNAAHPGCTAGAQPLAAKACSECSTTRVQASCTGTSSPRT